MKEKILKPVSDAMRKALELFGETPAEHQQSILDQMNAKAKKGLLKEANAKVVAGKEAIPASVIVDAWKEQVEWRADARVLFLRRQTCLNCQTSEVVLHWPEMFIRERKERRDALRTFKYVPARSAILRGAPLPFQRQYVRCDVDFCPRCMPESEHPLKEPMCLSELILSPLGDTESPPLQSQNPDTSSAGQLPLSQSNAAEPSGLSASGIYKVSKLAYMDLGIAAGDQLPSFDFSPDGSDSWLRNPSPLPANVTLTLSLTDGINENAPQ